MTRACAFEVPDVVIHIADREACVTLDVVTSVAPGRKVSKIKSETKREDVLIEVGWSIAHTPLNRVCQRC